MGCRAYSPPEVNRIWDIWGSYDNIPKAVFSLLKGDYRIWKLKPTDHGAEALLDDILGEAPHSATTGIMGTYNEPNVLTMIPYN